MNDPISNFLNEKIVNEQALLNLCEYMVENTEEDLKRFFPYLLNSIGGSLQMFFPIATSIHSNETKLIQDICSGVKIKVHMNNSPSPNAFTYPSLQTTTGPQVLNLASLVGMGIPAGFIWALYGVSALEDFDGKRSGDKIVFSNPKNIEVLAWETKGLIGMMTEDERRAVLLHEIGHWTRFRPVAASLFAKFGIIIPSVGIIFLILSMLLARSGEYQADNFTKICGYSPHMVTALDKMYHGRRSNVSILGKIDDIIRVISMAISNILDEVLPIAVHPNLRRRKRELEKEDLKEMFILDEGAKDLAMKLIAKVLSPLDKFAAKHVDLLFPLAKQ